MRSPLTRTTQPSCIASPSNTRAGFSTICASPVAARAQRRNKAFMRQLSPEQIYAAGIAIGWTVPIVGHGCAIRQLLDPIGCYCPAFAGIRAPLQHAPPVTARQVEDLLAFQVVFGPHVLD